MSEDILLGAIMDLENANEKTRALLCNESLDGYDACSIKDAASHLNDAIRHLRVAQNILVRKWSQHHFQEA